MANVRRQPHDFPRESSQGNERSRSGARRPFLPIISSPHAAGFRARTTARFGNRRTVCQAGRGPMKLVIVHYHLRAGGVRRIIEQAAPHLVRAQPGLISCVAVVTGEAHDVAWNRAFAASLAPRPIEWVIEPACGYAAELRDSARGVQQRLEAALDRVVGRDALVWVHNLGLGRNPRLARALDRICAARAVPLVVHHHDWWFDNRWSRWTEMRRAGIRTLAAAATAVLPEGPHVRHFTINQADARRLGRYFGTRTAWLPNLTEPAAPPSPDRCRAARRWLDRRLGEAGAPVWLVPCRLLRRKNLAEAVLLTRWLRPEAWLVTTAGVSSAEERPYADRLAAAARAQAWRVRWSVLAEETTPAPSVSELMAVSEAILLTSIQEGFGLPYLEAAAAGRPLLARLLPGIAPDLGRFGFRFPQSYPDLLIPTGLFDASAERARQERWFRAWRSRLPRACQRLAAPPAWLDAAPSSRPVAFSRLTLTAQLEVLSRSPAESWAACAPLNSFLEDWKRRAATGSLAITPWPPGADRWLSGPAYARRFWRGVQGGDPRPVSARPSVAAQAGFIRNRLAADHCFPLLWQPGT